MEKILALDPGTTNLGWALVQGAEVLDCGVENIWKDQKNVFESLTKCVVSWFKDNLHIFREADVILIEHQYQGKGLMQVFKPYLVMSALYTCCEMEFPGKVETVSPSAVKAFFNVSGTYEQRKQQVVQLAGFQHMEGRTHDMADCVLMAQYKQARDVVKAEQHKVRMLREQKRAAVRSKLAERVSIQTRKVATGPGRCPVCNAEVRKLCKGVCPKCYQRAYRAKNKL